MKKFVFEKYRSMSIWLCIAILACAAVVFSNDPHKELWVMLIFGLAGCNFALGALREWEIERKWFALMQSVLAGMSFAAFVWQILLLTGGV